MSVLYGKVRVYGEAGQTITITTPKGQSRQIQTIGQDFTDIALAGMEEYTLSNGFRSEDILLNVGDFKEIDMPFIPQDLETATWGQIKTAVQNGTLSQFASEGDTKSIILGGNTIHLQLVSINDGTGTAGTYYPNGTADFISIELLPDSYKMNLTETNVGGWYSSAMRTYLNETIYPTLPSDLKDVIIEKTHMRTRGNKSTLYQSEKDKLWLPTEWEFFGASHYGEESGMYNKHYSIFNDVSSRIKKIVNSTSAISWWESSPDVNYTTDFCTVKSDGSYFSGSANILRGVALCFRIG